MVKMIKTSPLHKLIGHKVAQFSYERERMGVILQNGSELTIYNQMSVQDARSRGDLSVAGASVSSVREDSNLVCIEFDDGISWLISAHALDQMQNRGVMPSVVENALSTGAPFTTRAGTNGVYDAVTMFG